MTTRRELQNVTEISTNLSNVYEKTHELKKDYYGKRLELMERFVKAKERIANILESWNMV